MGSVKQTCIVNYESGPELCFTSLRNWLTIFIDCLNRTWPDVWDSASSDTSERAGGVIQMTVLFWINQPALWLFNHMNSLCEHTLQSSFRDPSKHARSLIGNCQGWTEKDEHNYTLSGTFVGIWLEILGSFLFLSSWTKMLILKIIDFYNCRQFGICCEIQQTSSKLTDIYCHTHISTEYWDWNVQCNILNTCIDVVMDVQYMRIYYCCLLSSRYTLALSHFQVVQLSFI